MKLGHSVQKSNIVTSVPKCGCIATSRLEHCDFAIGALQLGSRGIATGAFRQRGIPTYPMCMWGFRTEGGVNYVVLFITLYILGVHGYSFM